MHSLSWFRGILTLGLALVVGAVSASAQVTAFSTDVTAAIDAGIANMAANGAYGDANPSNGSASSAGNAAGLAALALLEKRAGADQNAAATGYTGATPLDKARIDEIIGYIIANHTAAGFYAYRDGANLMALSVYLRTGGGLTGLANYPTQATTLNSLNSHFDRVRAAQGGHGYWCYFDGSCLDASTTQLVMAGLAAVRGVYLAGPFADAGRLAQLNAAATLARNAYASIPAQSPLPPGTELGHGYNRGNENSLQQTASGLWVQLVGGADINDVKVQAYLEWIRNRYDHDDNSNASAGWIGNGFGGSAFYYLWTAAKAFEFLENSGVAASGSNLDTADLGVLPEASAPAFPGRKLHLDPATVTRPAVRGPGGAGYYNDPNEQKRWYFDFAYNLMAQQQANGSWICMWECYSNWSYALLVLNRSVGGGCLDTDGDGICDSDEQEGTIKLNVGTSPGTGTAGVSRVMVTGGGWPNVAIPNTDTTIYIATTCKGPSPTTTTSTRVQTVLGTTKRAYFTVPGSLAAGTYHVWITGQAGGGYGSANCSILKVVNPAQ